MEERKEEEKEIGVEKTSKRGFAKFFSQIFSHFATPDSSMTKQATDHRPNSFNTKQATDDLSKQMWIRKEPDADGFFLLQLGKQIDYNNMFLTADDASSLTIARK